MIIRKLRAKLRIAESLFLRHKTSEAPIHNELRASLFKLRQKLRQKPYKLSKLNDCKGDPSKRWFVYYSLLNPKTGKFKREKEYIPAQYKKARDRYVVADMMIETIDLLLKNGELTFENRYNPTYSKKEYKIQEAIQLAMDSLENKLERKSFLGYRSVCKQFMEWLENTPYKDDLITDFKKKSAAHYLDHIATKNIANVTQNKIRNYLSAVFNQLIEKDIIEVNPWFGFKSKKEAQTKIDIWNESDLQRFFEYVKNNDQDFYLASLFLFHGFVRPIELCRMKAKHIDLNKRIAWIDVRKGKKIRDVQCSLSKPLVKLLTKRIKSMKPDDYVFSKTLGPGPTNITPRRFKSRLDEIKEKLTFERREAVFYELKHTGVSIAAAKGIPMINIRNQCRHTSITTTEKYLRSLKSANDNYFYNFPDQDEVKGMFN